MPTAANYDSPRGAHFTFDRHRLGYLNLIEKLNCDYCAYANGLFAYALNPRRR